MGSEVVELGMRVVGAGDSCGSSRVDIFDGKEAPKLDE
jgi:hypothetical protein